MYGYSKIHIPNTISTQSNAQGCEKKYVCAIYVEPEKHC
jgi:hypothetical protein